MLETAAIIISALSLGVSGASIWYVLKLRKLNRERNSPQYRRTDLSKTVIDPDAETDAPGKPAKRARVTTAHLSQPRAYWNDES